MIKGLFNDTISLLENTLDLRAQRQKLISSNIANQETPGYKAVDINFEQELRKRTGGSANGSSLLRTSPMHMPVIREGEGPPAVVERATEVESYDKNSVGIEGEMVKLSENAINYNMAIKMLRSKFSGLMNAIKEGGR